MISSLAERFFRYAFLRIGSRPELEFLLTNRLKSFPNRALTRELFPFREGGIQRKFSRFVSCGRGKPRADGTRIRTVDQRFSPILPPRPLINRSLIASILARRFLLA